MRWIRPKSDYFREASERNALRRSSGLPLLDMRTEIERLAMADYFIAYNEAWEAHRDVYQRLYDGILAEKRAKTGKDWNSAGGRQAVAILAWGRMSEYLYGIGWAPPRTARKIV